MGAENFRSRFDFRRDAGELNPRFLGDFDSLDSIGSVVCSRQARARPPVVHEATTSCVTKADTLAVCIALCPRGSQILFPFLLSQQN